MSLNVSQMSIADIFALQKQIEERISALTEEVKTRHHPLFIEKIGLETLLNIPEVTAESLGLDKGRKYPTRDVTPAKLGEKSVVQGLDGSNRPFIAVKVDLFDANTGKKVAQVVEVVFKRYSLHVDGANNAIHGRNYVTALSNESNEGQVFTSGLYSSGGMSVKQFEHFSRLLKGERVEHLYCSLYTMQKA